MAGLAGTPLSLEFLTGGQPNHFANAVFVVGAMLITQWLFLCPRGRLKLQLTEKGRPLWLSVATAALAATLLSMAFIATMLEIPGWWGQVWSPVEGLYHVVWLTMGMMWFLWALLFHVYWRGKDRWTYLTRMLKWLIRGSILEMLVAAPVQAMVWDRWKDCYCSRGSYTGLVLGGTVLMWAFGPGILLLFLREEYRREIVVKERRAK